MGLAKSWEICSNAPGFIAPGADMYKIFSAVRSVDAAANGCRAALEDIIDQIDRVADIEAAIGIGVTLIAAIGRWATLEDIVDHIYRVADIDAIVIIGITSQITA